MSRDFGTGAVKVTPAHDPNDFAIGQRHGLPSINVMDETAHMNADAGAYAGLDRYEARQRVLADLEAQGLLVAVKDHVNTIGKCDRCKTVVEPRLSTQWFVEDSAARRQGDRRGGAGLHPLHARTILEDVLRVDAQHPRLVHLAPAVVGPSHSGVALRGVQADHCGARDAEACAHCGSVGDRRRRPTCSTRGSPRGCCPVSVVGLAGTRRRDLDAFYPTQLLVTGFDILFFWVARMIMLGCHFMLDVPMPDGSQRT